MTTLVLNYSQNLLESIWGNIKGFGRSLACARQMSANIQIAEYLVRSGEYKDYHQCLYELNEKAMKEWGIK